MRCTKGIVAYRRGGAAAPTFFGQYTMYREIWAEDPDWSNPGDGNALTTVRDNGTVAADYTASGDNGTVAPHYVASLIGGRPGFDFRASSNSVGGKLESSEPGSAPSTSARTVVIVGRIDTLYSSYGYFCDAIGTGSSASQRRIVGAGAQAVNTFGMYATGTIFVNAGTVDSDDHLWVARFESGAHTLYKDGTLIGTDGTAGYTTSRNTVIGRSRDTLGCLDGAISYYAEFDGDLISQSGFSDWMADIQSYYSIT